MVVTPPQPALARVALRGQLSGHLASGGGAVERAEAGFGKVKMRWTPPQPAPVRVAARGQPSGHLASGGVARGSDVAVAAMAQACWDGRRETRRGVEQVNRSIKYVVGELLGVTGRPSIGGATKVTPELGAGNPLNKEPRNGSSAKVTWSMRMRRWYAKGES